MIGIAEASRIEDVGGDPYGSERDDQAPPDPAAALASGWRSVPGPAGTLALPRAGPAGDVGGERGQVGAGPRGERPARPGVELVPGQPALHERVLQRLDHLLAVGVARPDPATARRCRVLRSCHHRHPLAPYGPSVARPLPGGHAQLANATPPPTPALSSTFNHGVDGWIAYGLESFKPLS